MPLRRTIQLALAMCAGLLLGQAGLAQSNSFALTTLVNFTGVNGSTPVSNLIQASDGNYYGTTLQGGPNGCGTVFQLTPAGIFTTLHNFAGTDGRYPYGGLVEGSDGYLYGTTTEGGSLEQGTVFRISSSGTFVTLHSFTGPDGNLPYANLILATDGNFYGTTGGGGANGYGTIFRMASTGAVTAIYSFTGEDDGEFPYNNLVQASDGNLYGVASTGGSGTEEGVIFQSSLSGTVAWFGLTGTNSATYPYSGLDEDGTEHIYGTSSSGGATGFGEIFSIGDTGAITDVYDLPDSGNARNPFAGLVLGTDGNQYGTAHGYFNDGAVFSLSPEGEGQVLANFSADTGQLPYSPLMQGSDGNFYGTTSAGGSDGGSDGTVFRLTASPALPAPVELSLSAQTVPAGTPVTLFWQAINAYSATLQQCYAFVSGNAAGAGQWTGLQPGELSGDSYQGSTVIVPTVPGQYTYALTCGGVESGSTSLAVTGTGEPSTTTTLAITPSSLTQGQYATLAAKVVANTGTFGGTGTVPTGTVTFRYGPNIIGAASVNSAGTASLTGSSGALPPGNYILSASYAGDATHAPSNSPDVAVELLAQTVTALSVTPAQLASGSAATLVATVGQAYGSGLPTGAVTFYYEHIVLGQAVLIDGQATLVQSTYGVPAGSYPINAVYAGDAGDAPSTSAVVIATVTQ